MIGRVAGRRPEHESGYKTFWERPRAIRKHT
jgi:hypothetical protein